MHCSVCLLLIWVCACQRTVLQQCPLFGRLHPQGSPVRFGALHKHRQLAFHELCALYAVTDVALVTSLRDGMNLVSYEYVACQSDNAGARASPGGTHVMKRIVMCLVKQLQ